MAGPHAERIRGKAVMAGHDKYGIHSAGGKVGGKATMAGPHAERIHSKGGKEGGLQADPAKQKSGGPCNKCGRTECNACHVAEHREQKRKAQQAEQKGKQSIEQMFAAAAAKKLKQE
jgi:hypothetical protein